MVIDAPFLDKHCTECGELIPAPRLAAKPNASQCVPCLEKMGDVPRLRRNEYSSPVLDEEFDREPTTEVVNEIADNGVSYSNHVEPELEGEEVVTQHLLSIPQPASEMEFIGGCHDWYFAMLREDNEEFTEVA